MKDQEVKMMIRNMKEDEEEQRKEDVVRLLLEYFQHRVIVNKVDGIAIGINEGRDR